MKSALTILCFILYWPCNLAVATEKPVIDIVYDPFANFYPHLGDSICRKKAFEIPFNKTDKEKEVELWKKYKKTCSVDGSYQLILAGMYMSHDRQDYNEAKQILEKDIDSYPSYDTRYHKSMLHSSYLGLKEKSKAINLAKQIINDYPNWYRGYRDLGFDFIENKDWVNAKQYLEKALKMYNQDPITYLSLAYVSYELREDDKVLDYYWKAFCLDPFTTHLDFKSSAAAVVVNVNNGMFEQAKDILDHQQELNPDIIKSRRFIGIKQYYENALKKANKSL